MCCFVDCCSSLNVFVGLLIVLLPSLNVFVGLLIVLLPSLNVFVLYTLKLT